MIVGSCLVPFRCVVEALVLAGVARFVRSSRRQAGCVKAV